MYYYYFVVLLLFHIFLSAKRREREKSGYEAVAIIFFVECCGNAILIFPFTWGGWLDIGGGGGGGGGGWGVKAPRPLTTPPLITATILGKYKYSDDNSKTEELLKSTE